MLARKVGDRNRLGAVLDFLDGSDPISDDTVQWLRRGIRGHYGGEGYVLNVPDKDEAAFWLALHQPSPENAWLCFVAADARSGWDDPEAIRLFFRSFELDASLVHELEGWVCNVIGESEYRLDLALIRLAEAVKKNDANDLHTKLTELRFEYREDPEALRRIEQVARDA